MSRVLYPLALVVLLATLVAGCGDGGGAPGPATFDDPRFDVAFDYPGSFKALENVSFDRQEGSTAVATAGVGIDGSNLIAVQRFDQKTAITDRNLDDVRPQADKLFSELAGMDLKGREVEVGGLPALQYEIDLTEPAGGQTRATAIFDEETEYLINCQSTPSEHQAVAAACDQALGTLRTK